MKDVFIIAEAGVNHNGSIEIAKKLIDKAVAAGADAVKFQTFKTENKKYCKTIHNIQKFVAFLYTNNGLSEKEKITPFVIASKNKIHRNKFTERSGRPLH